MSAPPILPSLSRHSAGVAYEKASHLCRMIPHRTMYSFPPRQKNTNESPKAVLKSAPSSRLSKAPSPPAHSASGSTRRVTPSKAADSRTAQTRSQNLNCPGPNKNTYHHFGAGVLPRANVIPPQSRPQVIQRGKENSREYKSAARKWVASIIALPIFIVTSYFLYDRRMPPLGPSVAHP